MRELASVLDYQPDRLFSVPAHLREGLKRFIEHGVKPGSALWGVICNAPVAEVVPKLDPVSMAGLPNLLHFLTSCAPGRCWGDEARADAWALLGGLHGYLARRDDAGEQTSGPPAAVLTGAAQGVSNRRPGAPAAEETSPHPPPAERLEAWS